MAGVKEGFGEGWDELDGKSWAFLGESYSLAWPGKSGSPLASVGDSLTYRTSTHCIKANMPPGIHPAFAVCIHFLGLL